MYSLLEKKENGKKKVKKENEHSEKQLLHVCTHIRLEKKRYIFTQNNKKERNTTTK